MVIAEREVGDCDIARDVVDVVSVQISLDPAGERVAGIFLREIEGVQVKILKVRREAEFRLFAVKNGVSVD